MFAQQPWLTPCVIVNLSQVVLSKLPKPVHVISGRALVYIQKSDWRADKPGMLAKQYIAKDEFELYGALVKELSEVDFSKNTAHAFCFRSDKKGTWQLVDAVETEVPETCGEFVLKYRPTSFVVVISVGKTLLEVCFQGRELLLIGEFDGKDLSVVEFEDKNPNEEFKKFEKQEQDEAVEFVKNHFKKAQV